MSNGKTSAEERIAILERRDEESRRTIRALSEMLSRAMDRIEELQNERRRSRRERTTVVYVESPEKAPSSDPLFLDTAEVAELLGVSRATALKLVKKLGGPMIGSKYGITFSKLDEFVSSGRHIDLS